MACDSLGPMPVRVVVVRAPPHQMSFHLGAICERPRIQHILAERPRSRPAAQLRRRARGTPAPPNTTRLPPPPASSPFIAEIDPRRAEFPPPSLSRFTGLDCLNIREGYTRTGFVER